MDDGRQKQDFEETLKNAFSGYAMTVLGVVCFVLFLVAVTFVVRLVVGAGAGAGV